MTKVDIKRLDSITKNDTTATEQINDNFLALQTAIENTLSRDGTGPNYMDADLDMNSYRIINSSDPVKDNDIVNLKYVEERIGGAIEASNTAVSAASQAANSAQSALVSSTNAINILRNAEEQLSNVVQYVEEAEQGIENTIAETVEDVRQQALDAAQEAINDAAAQATAIVVDYANNEVKPQLNEIASNAEAIAENAAEIATNEADEARHWAEDSRVWATGEDAEVEEIAPGEEEHSSRGYADLAMAIANTPEDVPVDTSTLLALQIIKGPKGDTSVGSFTGDNTIEGTLNIKNDSNHPLKVTGLAGASASGFQVVDSNGAGESDFEHYATDDRYGTRITNKNNRSNTTVNIDLYQSNVGGSVLDLSDVETIFAPALLGAIYPVGSYYLSEAADCPLASLIAGSQWEKVGTSLVSGTEAPVVGNGMTLGLMASQTEAAGLVSYNDGSSILTQASTDAYGKPIGSSYSSGALVGARSIGITTDPEKSGVVANLPTITVNIFRRIM